MKDRSISKLDPKDMGQYHIRVKLNEVIEKLNIIARMMEQIRDEAWDKAEDAQSSSTSTD